MPRDASGRKIPGSYGPGRSGGDERALAPFMPRSPESIMQEDRLVGGIGGSGQPAGFHASNTIQSQTPNPNVLGAMMGSEPVDERYEPGSHLEDQNLTEKYRQIQAAYPGVSQEEMDEIYRKYQEDSHWAQRQGVQPEEFEYWLQQHKADAQGSRFGARQPQEVSGPLVERMSENPQLSPEEKAHFMRQLEQQQFGLQ